MNIFDIAVNCYCFAYLTFEDDNGDEVDFDYRSIGDDDDDNVDEDDKQNISPVEQTSDR